MINIKNKADCSGCHACVNVCSKGCIVMEQDEEGFLYPSVDMSKCVKCGLCLKVCHHHNPIKGYDQPKAYACYTTDESIRMNSSSGGMFTVFAREILNRGGAVFGAAFDENLKVKHIGVTEEKDLWKLRGSKYVQSCIGDTYATAKQCLQSGQVVFFTGTPCQTGGLKQYLGKEYDNLYTADVICHGAPSPKVWQTYLDYLEKQNHNKVDKQTPPFFRDKSQGWLGYSVKIYFEDHTEVCTSAWQDRYIGSFLNDMTLRPSCYQCEFKSLHRNSDITMADFWGVSEVLPEMFDNKGTSLILANTRKGEEFFGFVKDSIVYKPASLNEAVKHNPSAYKSAIRPFARTTFVKNINADNFDDLYQACSKKSLFERLWRKGKRVLDKIRTTASQKYS